MTTIAQMLAGSPLLDRERRLPFGALLLYQYYAASPTALGDDARIVVKRDGTLLRGRVDEPPTETARAPDAWLATVRASLSQLDEEPEARQLLPPPGSGHGPTDSGSYHFILARRGLFRSRAVFYSRAFAAARSRTWRR